MSPTQRSLAYLRKQGWTVCIVEKFNHFARVRQDAFGFGDLLAISPGKIILVQTTTGTNMAARRAKILSLTEFNTWILAGGGVLLHGWRKIGPRGKRKTWQVSEQWLSEIPGVAFHQALTTNGSQDVLFKTLRRRAKTGKV